MGALSYLQSRTGVPELLVTTFCDFRKQLTHTGRLRSMLENRDVAARLPAQDLERAKSFYAEKLPDSCFLFGAGYQSSLT